MTLVEFQALVDRWQEAEARADRRAALIAYYTTEGAAGLAAMWSSRRRPRRRASIDDYMPHRWPSVEDARRRSSRVQTAEEQVALLKHFFGQLGAVPEGS